MERHRRPGHRPDLPRRAIRPRVPVVPGIAVASSTGPRRSTSRRSRNWPRRAGVGGVRQQQDAAIAGSQQSTEKKREPVRNVGKKVGRNDPCPCGSGKKFKACCMRKHAEPTPSDGLPADSPMVRTRRHPASRNSASPDACRRAGARTSSLATRFDLGSGAWSERRAGSRGRPPG